jgi:hypothetical protein
MQFLTELLPYLQVFAAAFVLTTCIGCGVMAANTKGGD